MKIYTLIYSDFAHDGQNSGIVDFYLKENEVREDVLLLNKLIKEYTDSFSYNGQFEGRVKFSNKKEWFNTLTEHEKFLFEKYDIPKAYSTYDKYSFGVKEAICRKLSNFE